MTEQEKFLEVIKHLESTDSAQYEGFYNGYYLMNMRDLNNCVPEIFISTGNRTAGKTFFFKRLLVRYSLQTGTKFLWLTRKKTQLSSASQSFIADIQNCHDFKEQFKIEGSDFAGIKEITYSDICIGYVSYLNYADDIKESSNMFNDLSIIAKDEFQLVNPRDYVQDEMWKLRSIHKSCARGYGKHNRFLPVILISNMISIINPYFVALGIHKRFSPETKKMRGNGWCLQVTHNAVATTASTNSLFERAFGEDEQTLSDNFNKFMDSLNLVGKQNLGQLRMVCIFYVKKRAYGIWAGNNYFYVSTKYDISCKHKYALDLESHKEDTVLITRFEPFFAGLRKYFEKGYVRFQDVECRVALVDALAVTIL